MRRQLYTDKDDREIFSTIQDQLRRIDKRLEDGRAALQPLEMSLINVACDDPGAAIGAQLVLPLLQVRIWLPAVLPGYEWARKLSSCSVPCCRPAQGVASGRHRAGWSACGHYRMCSGCNT